MTESRSPGGAADPARAAKQVRTILWVMSLALVGLVFDGYDLVIYGACVSTFLRDATQLGTVTPAAAGQLGSCALVGVLVGALALRVNPLWFIGVGALAGATVF